MVEVVGGWGPEHFEPVSSSGYFVTGTGTGVGKTVAAAVTARVLISLGYSVSVFKPAVTGLDEPGEPDHVLLRRAAESDQTDEEIAPYRYGIPASPPLAAARAGEEIDPARLRRAAAAAAERAEMLVCEGVGGLMVPFSPGYLVRDFAQDLGLPLLIAALPGLGTINHTLLTIEAARAKGLLVRGVMLGPWPDEPGEIERSNLETLRRLSGAEVQTVPFMDLSDPATWD